METKTAGAAFDSELLALFQVLKQSNFQIEWNRSNYCM